MSELIEEPNEHDLVLIGTGNFPLYVSFTGQATTDNIADFRLPEHRYVLQKINGVWEVYDLKTLRVEFGSYTIGMPKFIHEDYDAALMWALMNV